MRAPRLPLCVLECARAVVELVGLESPWLVSGHTSILARYYDHKNGCLQHDSALQRLSQSDDQRSRLARYATHVTKLQRDDEEPASSWTRVLIAT